VANKANILVLCGVALVVGGSSTFAVLHHECVFAPSINSENDALDAAYVAALAQFSNEFYDATGAFLPLAVLRNKFPSCCQVTRRSGLSSWGEGVWVVGFSMRNSCKDEYFVSVHLNRSGAIIANRIDRPTRQCKS
jgi:hypothetical protein